MPSNTNPADVAVVSNIWNNITNTCEEENQHVSERIQVAVLGTQSAIMMREPNQKKWEHKLNTRISELSNY